ncbi:MAG TPA: lamin tail domain-containing protein, partial [Chthoniobacteraceae bacterium]|nr:lamin tail domain-containing protein [Chthoniobacteraceae bacterium]
MIRCAAFSALIFLTLGRSEAAAAPPVDAVIVFSEIMYHPAGGGDVKEWVEVQNAMGVSVDLSDWRLTGGIDFVFPDGTVLVGGATLVIAKTPGDIPGSIGPFTGTLDNGGETVQLRDRNGRLMDEIAYGDDGEWPVAADGSGASLSKRALESASYDPSSWTFSTRSGGTPGAENFPLPSPPTTTRVIAFEGAWSFENSGATPAANWTELNFDDTSWSTGSGGFGFGNPTVYQDATPNPVPLRTPITSLFNTGVLADGTLAAPGANELHFTAVTPGISATVQTGHPAWLGGDGVSQWIGLTGNGVDNVQAGQFVYRTAFSLNGWDPSTAVIRFFAAVDNTLDAIVVNGSTRTIGASGFAAFLGPFTVAGPFNFGANTIDFRWTNAGSSANPAGLRIKWDATAQPLLFRTTLSANPITTYFRKKFSYSGNAGSTYRVLLNSAADDGAVVYLNGQEVYRFNLPDGAVTSTTLASGEIVYPKFSGALDLPGNALVNGENVLAVELHQAAMPDPDAVWIASLDVVETRANSTTRPPLVMNEVAAGGSSSFFIELRNSGISPATLAGYTVRSSSGGAFNFGGNASLDPGELLSVDATTLGFLPAAGDRLFLLAPGETGIADAVVVTAAARARDAEGQWSAPNTPTPGNENLFTVNSAVVINEIMFHHAPVYLATGTVASPEQWIELHNRTDAAVDLGGWKMRGGADFDFAPGTVLPPRGYLVVSNNAAALLAKFPGIAVIGDLDGSLSHADDVIRLEEPNGNISDEVHYFGGGRWDERADGGGSSLELRDPDAENNVPEAWQASDESAKAAWQTFSYSGSAAVFPGSNDPTQYHEFIFGLLDAGEFLIDDVSVIENSAGNRQLIQNRDFTNG